MKNFNIYNKQKFDRSTASQIVNDIKDSCKVYYNSLSYIEHKPVDISSGIDPTVRFVGSHISVFKPYLKYKGVPSPGFFILQNCIRTQNLRGLFDDNYKPRWGSFFPSLGTVSPPDRLNDIVREVLEFFVHHLKVSGEMIVARVNSLDRDLLDVCKNNFDASKIQVDTMPINYYRHKLGMVDISGRNFNIALRNCDNEEYSDIGNIIVLEKNGVPVVVEVAIGVTTTIKQIYGLGHVLDCHAIIGLERYPQPFCRKLEDCILISLVLYREGLRPGGTNNRRRLLRSYLRGVTYLRASVDISLDDIGKIISNLEKLEFGESVIADKIVTDIQSFEKYLYTGDNLSPEELIIKSKLSS